MKQHGKKSASAAQIVQAMMRPGIIDGGFNQVKVEPPKNLPERVEKIWRATVLGESDKLFRTAATRGMLEAYCRHRATSEEMSELIDEFDMAHLAEAKGMRRYEWLTKMRRVETDAALKLATKLRLTNQSRYHPETVKTAGDARAEEGEGDDPWAEEKRA